MQSFPSLSPVILFVSRLTVIGQSVYIILLIMCFSPCLIAIIHMNNSGAICDEVISNYFHSSDNSVTHFSVPPNLGRTLKISLIQSYPMLVSVQKKNVTLEDSRQILLL